MMPRARRPNHGVGKGNGPGSRKSQFREDQPSGNPFGRGGKPGKVRAKQQQPLNGSILDAVQKERALAIPYTENGKAQTGAQIATMVKMLFAHYPRATVKEKIAILRFIMDIDPAASTPAYQGPSDETIDTVLTFMAKEAAEYEEKERLFGGRRP